jgi:hypothetical protein
VTFTYQKIEQNDLALKDWKRYLEQAEKTVFESELEDFQWYAVLKNNDVIAVFQIINVLNLLQLVLTLQNGSHFPPKNGVCAHLDKNAYASYCVHEKHCLL